MAQTTKEAVGNYGSGVGFVMRIGGGAKSTAPMMVPSTAPINGARYDFVYYPWGTLHLIKVNLKEYDTCSNVHDVLNTFSDSYRTPLACNVQACMDSHCTLLTVRLKKATSIGSPASVGTVYRASVRPECQSRQGAGVCSPFPQCVGEKCLEAGNIRLTGTGSALNVDRFYLYRGTDLEIDELTFPGSRAKVICGIIAVDDSCPNNAFTLDSSARDSPSNRADSFTGETKRGF
jgi:hypothetical protein